MTDPRTLKVQEVNLLPFSQACLNHLNALKVEVEDWELYAVQLLIWASEHHRYDLNLEAEYQDGIPEFLSIRPEAILRNLKLAELKSLGDPLEDAQLMAEEIKDRILGISPEDPDEMMYENIANGILDSSAEEAKKAKAKKGQARIEAATKEFNDLFK